VTYTCLLFGFHGFAITLFVKIYESELQGFISQRNISKAHVSI
jgi:hypothetical protein